MALGLAGAPTVRAEHRGVGADHAAVVVADHGGHGAVLDQPGTGRLGVAGQVLVEARAGPHQPVGREVGQLGPGDLDRAVAGAQPQPAIGAIAVLRAVRQVHELHLVHGARSEAVAADLLARMRRLLQDHDLMAVGGEPVGGGGSRRTAACDHDFHARSMVGAP